MASGQPNPVRALILRILDDAGSVYTTTLVKLMYFVDLYYFAQAGRSATGLQWIWDDYGPNVVDHEIIRTAGALEEEGVIRTRPAFGGDTARAYRSVSGDRPMLDPLLEAIVTEVIGKYGHLSVQELKEASKGTDPFQSAKPGRRLIFRQSARVAPPPTQDDWEKHVEQRDASRGKSVAELRTKYQLD